MAIYEGLAIEPGVCGKLSKTGQHKESIINKKDI